MSYKFNLYITDSSSIESRKKVDFPEVTGYFNCSLLAEAEFQVEASAIYTKKTLSSAFKIVISVVKPVSMLANRFNGNKMK